MWSDIEYQAQQMLEDNRRDLNIHLVFSRTLHPDDDSPLRTLSPDYDSPRAAKANTKGNSL